MVQSTYSKEKAVKDTQKALAFIKTFVSESKKTVTNTDGTKVKYKYNYLYTHNIKLYEKIKTCYYNPP